MPIHLVFNRAESLMTYDDSDSTAVDVQGIQRHRPQDQVAWAV